MALGVLEEIRGNRENRENREIKNCPFVLLVPLVLLVPFVPSINKKGGCRNPTTTKRFPKVV